MIGMNLEDQLHEDEQTLGHDGKPMQAQARGTIVVVEQSAAAQELMERALREAGHRVLVTRNPLEAFELGRRVLIDVLVADVVSLDEDGPGLVQRLRTIQPSLQVLYLADRGWLDGSDTSNSSALRAPFSLAELQEAVAVAIAGR
jgi:DNA-binding response OmpR family regulator